MRWDQDASSCYLSILRILSEDGELTGEHREWLTHQIEAYARERHHRRVTFADLDTCLRTLIRDAKLILPRGPIRMPT